MPPAGPPAHTPANPPSSVETPVVLAGASAIGWTDYTHNPWWGCARISPGCRDCYADTWSHRLGLNLWGKNADRRFFGDDHWANPLRWDRRAERDGTRRRVFCASMGDVFEDLDILTEHRQRLWDLVDRTPHLDWLLLTKRPHNIRPMVPAPWLQGQWPTNVWAGTTIEDQQRAQQRIPALLDTPAPRRFLSCEPLLDHLDLDLAGIHWLIIGGETGPDRRRREMNLDHLVALANTCTTAGVPLFVKQDSGRYPGRQGRIPPDLWARKETPRPVTATQKDTTP
jgi:protein gp37